MLISSKSALPEGANGADVVGDFRVASQAGLAPVGVGERLGGSSGLGGRAVVAYSVKVPLALPERLATLGSKAPAKALDRYDLREFVGRYALLLANCVGGPSRAALVPSG